MSRPPGPRTGPFCPGITTKGNPCQHKPGHRTKTPGTGPCVFHGGVPAKAGAPAGNKNALTTGEYETLYVSALTDEEANLYQRISDKPLANVIEELRLTSIRIHRILIRIKRATELEASSEDGMEIISRTSETGWDKGKTYNSKVEYASIQTTIMHLDSALGRAQLVKARWVTELRGSLKENPGDSGGLDRIVDVIDRSAATIARAKEAERQALEDLL